MSAVAPKILPGTRAGSTKATTAQIPAYFEANRGQFPRTVRFVARMSGYTAWFTDRDVILTAGDRVHPAKVHMQLVDSGGTVHAGERLPGRVNYFIGSDAAKWHRGIPIYDRIVRQHAYPGIDVVYRIAGNELEYDLVVAPGGDPNQIKLRFTGAKLIHLDPAGSLILSTAAGEIRQHRPDVYEQGAAIRKKLDGWFVVSGKNATFAIDAYDRSKALVIDPAIAYSTYLGGTNGGSTAVGVVTYADPTTGHVYAFITGNTCDNDFPVLNPEQATYAGGCYTVGGPWNGGDAFVAKLDSAASGANSLLYSTYIGGGRNDLANGIAVDGSGQAYVTGTTSSDNFPGTNNAYLPVCFANSCSLHQQAFLSKLSANGSTLLYSTLFGGTGYVRANAIALNPAGLAYIGGYTSAPDLPMVNAYQSVNRGESGAFVAGFDTSRFGQGSLVYSTFLENGTACTFSSTSAWALAVDAAGAIHVAGSTSPGNDSSGNLCPSTFPFLNGYQSAPPPGVGAAFYTKLNPSAPAGASELMYSTYLGGSGDRVYSMALDGSGNAYLSGNTSSGVFPATAQFSQGNTPFTFVAKIDSSKSGSASLIYSAQLPGLYGTPVRDSGPASAVAVDPAGDAFVVANTSGGLPLVNPVQSSPNGVFQTLDGGTTWTGLTRGLPGYGLAALAIDTSTSPSTLYAIATDSTSNLFRSTDGGLTWNQVLQLGSQSLSNCSLGRCFALAVDPSDPSNVFAGSSTGVYKSSDRGNTWVLLNDGLGTAEIRDIQFDSGVLYAGTKVGLYTLKPGASAWAASPLMSSDVHHISFDPRTSPHTIYTASENNSGFRSSDGGNTWSPVQTPGGCLSFILVDTNTTPSTLYGKDQAECGGSDFVFTSNDGGNTWSSQGIPNSGNYLSDDPNITPVIDTTHAPSTTYWQGTSWGLVKSSDGFNTFTYAPSANVSLGPIVLDAATASGSAPAALYAGTQNPVDTGFIAELNPSGSALVFSSYLAGMFGYTIANGIALDAVSNIYIAGRTDSGYFPIINAYQPQTPSWQWTAFVAKVGNQPLPQSSASPVNAEVGVSTGALTVTLPNITGSTTNSVPTLSVDPVSPATTANFSLSNNLGAYDISTTASFSGSVTLCFQALTVNDSTTFSNLQLFHIENGTLVDVTSSRDFSTKTVCGTVTSLSPFVLFSPSTSTIVSSTLKPSTFGQSVTFTVNVVAAGAATGTITFRDGSTVLATVPLSSGQASLSTSALTAGSHSITASYSGDTRFLGNTSAVLAEMVNRAQTATAASTSVTTFIFNQSVTLTATVGAISPGSGIPTGTVTFKDGNTTLGTGNLSSGTATFTTSLLAVGSHSITAVYGGDSNFMGSASTAMAQQVRYEPAGTTCLGNAGHQILQPISPTGNSVWKQGRTIPAQFRVCDFNGVSVGTPGVVSSFYRTQIISGTVTNVDETVSSTSSDTAFHWDATNQQWVFNISTTSLAANNTYVYTITLNDGTTIQFQYGLK
jgi:hypothetical protein